MTTIDQVRDFIVNELRWNGDPAELTGDFNLLVNGVIDSLGLFRIVAFLEDRYGVEIDDEELVAQNFATLASIARLAERST